MRDLCQARVVALGIGVCFCLKVVLDLGHGRLGCHKVGVGWFVFVLEGWFRVEMTSVEGFFKGF